MQQLYQMVTFTLKMRLTVALCNVMYSKTAKWDGDLTQAVSIQKGLCISRTTILPHYIYALVMKARRCAESQRQQFKKWIHSPTSLPSLIRRKAPAARDYPCLHRGPAESENCFILFPGLLLPCGLAFRGLSPDPVSTGSGEMIGRPRP